MECMKQTKRQWQIRLLEEVERDKTGQFVTLSFSNEELIKLEEEIKAEYPKIEGYDLDNEVATLATHRFRENWRKETGKSPKHWLITELGQKKTERIHIHGIIWNRDKKMIIKKWVYGNVYIGDYVNGATANYIVKYVHKVDMIHPNYKPKILTSPAIGKGYIKGSTLERNKYRGDKTREYYETRQGYKMNLPIYYRNKIYTEAEREELWLMKLDKQERWVNGIKIDISKGDKEYYGVLDHARRLSKQLGYGDDRKQWDKEKYENARRELIRKDRHTKKDEPSIKRNYETQSTNNSNNHWNDYDRMQNARKDFESDKDNRIQENQKVVEERRKSQEVFRGIDKDKESIQIQIWS